MRKVIASLVLSVAATSAYAWGAVEQAALAGVVGGYIIGNANRGSVQYGYTAVPPPPVAYYGGYHFRPRYSYQYQPQYYCQQVPLYNAYNQVIGFQNVCGYQ